MKLAGAMLCLALCCLAAATAAQAATVGPWSSFQQRVQAGVKIASTSDPASLSAAEYNEHYEHAIRVGLHDLQWRGCGIGGYSLISPAGTPPIVIPPSFTTPLVFAPLQFYAQWDFGCPRHDDYYGNNHYGGARYGGLGGASACLTCSIEYGLSLGGLNDFNTRGGVAGIVGHLNGFCYASKLADSYGAPLCSNLALTLQGDVSLAFVRSKTGDFAPASGQDCPNLAAAVDIIFPTGTRSAGDASDATSNPLSLFNSVISGARGHATGARAAADAAASTAYYNGPAPTLNFGLAIVFSGVTTVANAKDEDIKHGGFFEYTPFFNALNATEVAALQNKAGFVVPSAQSVPVVEPGELELAFFA